MGGPESSDACSDQRHDTFQLPLPLPSPPPWAGFLRWREELVGDSDSESDDDSRAVVGINADWTKEVDPEHIVDQ